MAAIAHEYGAHRGVDGCRWPTSRQSAGGGTQLTVTPSWRWYPPDVCTQRTLVYSSLGNPARMLAHGDSLHS